VNPSRSLAQSAASFPTRLPLTAGTVRRASPRPPRLSAHAVHRTDTKDRDVLLTFYDFPAEHWKHLRTTNPIESTFATIRLRHRRTKGNGTRKTSLAMMFKLAQAAQKRWRRLNGHEQLDLLLQGKAFVDGEVQEAA